MKVTTTAESAVAKPTFSSNDDDWLGLYYWKNQHNIRLSKIKVISYKLIWCLISCFVLLRIVEKCIFFVTSLSCHKKCCYLVIKTSISWSQKNTCFLVKLDVDISRCHYHKKMSKTKVRQAAFALQEWCFTFILHLILPKLFSTRSLEIWGSCAVSLLFVGLHFSGLRFFQESATV